MISKCEHNPKCVDSRWREDEGYRYRRYKCTKCGYRWSTCEMDVDATYCPSEVLSPVLNQLYLLSDRQRKAIEELVEAFKEDTEKE